MKKLLPIFLLLFFFQESKSQNWCPPGATWYTNVWSGLLGYDAIVEYKYSHDTTIQTKNCKIIVGTLSGKDYQDYSTLNYTLIPNYRTYITFESNKVLYLFNGTTFDTVMNFNAQIGDKWLAFYPCGVKWPYTVRDTGHTTINNINLRSILVSTTYTFMNGANLVTDSVKSLFYEKIFSFSVNWQDLFFRRCPITNTTNTQEVPWSYYCGYKDDNFPLFVGSNATCKYTGLNENTSEKSEFAIFPNPNQGFFTVVFSEPSQLSVFDALGKEILVLKFEDPGNHDLNLSNLETGIYTIRLKNKSGTAYRKFARE